MIIIIKMAYPIILKLLDWTAKVFRWRWLDEELAFYRRYYGRK